MSLLELKNVSKIYGDLKALDNCYFSEEELLRIEEISAPVQLKTL